jgi:hypothetical protein
MNQGERKNYVEIATERSSKQGRQGEGSFAGSGFADIQPVIIGRLYQAEGRGTTIRC